jgi:hypothetical protein
MEFSFTKQNNSFLYSSAGVSFIPTVAFEGLKWNFKLLKSG